MRILVADDDEQYRALIRRTLERAGHEVVAVADGLAVLAGIDAPGLQLVVLDLIMPGKEGLETIMAIRRQRPDLRVIAISGAGVADADAHIAALASFGLDLDVLGAKLQHDGLAQFATAFAKMLELTA